MGWNDVSGLSSSIIIAVLVNKKAIGSLPGKLSTNVRRMGESEVLLRPATFCTCTMEKWASSLIMRSRFRAFSMPSCRNV